MIDFVTGKMTEEQKSIYYKYRNKFPFKIVEFMNELGIRVTASGMPNGYSGGIRKEEDTYRVYINDSHAPARLMFTLAHELGHYFYDKDYLESYSEIIDLSKQSLKIFFIKQTCVIDPKMRLMDINANQFAAELLMPENKFIKIWNKETTPEQVAKFFGVSVEAVKIRASVLLGEIF